MKSNLICRITRNIPNLSFAELSKILCELVEWKRPNGKLKHEECRTLLEHLQSGGIVTLHKLRPTAAVRLRKITITAQSNPQTQIAGSAGQFEPRLENGATRRMDWMECGTT